MKISAKIFRSVYTAAIALLLCSASCSEEISEGEGETDKPVKITISISTLSDPLSTKGTPTDPETENEKISSWFLVFVNRAGRVEQVVSRDRELSNAVEEESFSCIMPAGNYKIFAFANVKPGDISRVTGYDLAPGEPVDVAKLSNAEWDDETNGNLNLFDSSKPLPMTGYREVTVRNTTEERFSIEMVRMVAKIELNFLNPDSRDVVVSEIRLDPVTSTPVSLFPRDASGISYVFLGQSAYTPRDNAQYSMLTYTLPQPILLEKEGGRGTVKFYCKESISDRLNDNSFTVGLTLRYDDDTREYLQYNLTRDIRDYINRNDRIVIPVTLSSYDVKAEALFYPPIGGYPTVMTGEDAEGSQIFTFATQGEFAITPTVTDRATGELLPSSSYTVEVSEILDEKGILTGVPKIVEEQVSAVLPKEFRGILTEKEGKARITLTFTIGSKTYTRYIYLIRK